LFEKYSKRKSLINLFRRKHKPEVLRYNLQKLLSMPMVGQACESRQDGPGTIERKLVITDGRVRLEDLPCHLRPLYEQNRTLYKQMRSLHEKMKLATHQDQRAKLRGQIAQYDDVIAGNWEKIDGWDPDGDPAQEDGTPEDPGETKRQIGAIRKFLSVNLRKVQELEGLKRQQLIFKIGERALQLQKLGVKPSETTRDELRGLGIDI